MNESLVVVHAEMCIGIQVLAWAAVLVILLHVNFIVGIRAQSTPNKFAISENDDSLALKNGWLNSVVHRPETSGAIDGNEAPFPPGVKTAQWRNLLRNELVTSESDNPAVRHVQETDASAKDGKEEAVKEEKEEEKEEEGRGEDGHQSSWQTFPENRDVGLMEDNDDISDNNDIYDNIVDEITASRPNSLLSNDASKLTNYEQFVEVPSMSYEQSFFVRDNNQDPDDLSPTFLSHTPDILQNSYSQFLNDQGLRDKRDTSASQKSDFPNSPDPDSNDDTNGKTSIEYKTSNNGDIVALPPNKHNDDYESDSNDDYAISGASDELDDSSSGSRAERQISPEALPSASSRNIRARKEGDAIIGALFPLHQAPTQKTAYTRQCGEIREYYGIQRVEAFLMTIEKINSDPTILPNITLGWDIRDSCWYSAIALENSIDFIKDAIASQSKNIPTAGQTGTGNDNNSVTSVMTSLSTPLTTTMASPNRSDNVPVCRDNKYLRPIAGLVGPGSSEATIQVQNLLQIFNIPQIGYSATSMDLSDKSHYKYFLRVVPPDRYQARAMVDIVVRFNWTYISTVHSDGNYGIRGMEKFMDLARAKGICIATSDNVASTAEDAAFDSVLDNLLQTPNASVVVCFCEGMTVKKLLMATRRRNMEGRFLFIGSDGWGNRLDVVEDQETAAAGGISIKLYSPPLNDFGAHYAKLKPDGSPYNPWFNEFWEWKFRCSLDKDDLKGFTRFCMGNESLRNSDYDSKLGFVVNAVTTMARALHNMHRDVCPGSIGLCPAMEPINGSVYLQYLLNVSFKSYSGEQVHFDSKGDPPGRYEILNYQPHINVDGNVTYDYVTIGHWMTGSLQLNGHSMYWPRGRRRDGNLDGGIIKSVCSEPCKWGQAKKVKGVACCWICTMCLENEILVDNNTDCTPCDLGLWPNRNKTDCEEIPVDFISWTDSEAIVCITLGCLGICVTMWICAIFIRYHDTPIVKASTRELSYIILVGICLAFSANFFIVAKPAKGFCYLTRILPGLSFSLMYGALVTRTNRIARILEGSKRIMTKKPRFMSATAQVVITGIIIGIECAVITGMLVYQPADSKLDYPAPRKVRLVCDTSTLGIVVPLGFDLVLILLCTIYAVKTRNLPENFNEAKFIGFTMYSTCVIWLGFFPIYFAGENKEITLSISVSLSAAIALILLFMPKVYVIVWVPEKNTRGAFTTSRDVRCHIGSKSMASGDSVDIKESSTCDNFFKSEKSQGKGWRQKSLDEKRLRFVMQRAGGADGETPYINHGVLTNHSSLRGATFVDRDSKDSSRTDTTPVSTLSRPDKDKLYPIELKEVSSVEVIRQNLARDYPMHNKPKAPLRPGSPAEKEKHRIHNVDHLVDLDELLGVKELGSHPRHGRPGDFRKSLSSTCVSTCPKSKSVQCQTSDDLVHYSLPPLRKRCVSKSKNKLERSGAVIDDNLPPAARQAQEVHVFKYPSPCHSKSLTIQRSPVSPNHPDDPCISPSDLSETSPLVVCHNYDQHGLCFSPDKESSFTPVHVHNDPRQRRRSHNHVDLRPSGGHRRCSHDLLPSTLLPLSDWGGPQTFKPQTVTPSESTDFSFMDGIEELENSVSPAYARKRGSALRQPLQNLPEPGVSPSSHSAQGASNWCHTNDNSSTTSLNHQDSCSSTPTISTASSSFTLPPFHTSTDSNPSQQTFGDSDDFLEPGENGGGGNGSSGPLLNAALDDGEEDAELSQILNNKRTAQFSLEGEDSVNSNSSSTQNDKPVVAPVASSDQEMLEFHKYLQGHGVKLDLATAQTSDL